MSRKNHSVCKIKSRRIEQQVKKLYCQKAPIDLLLKVVHPCSVGIVGIGMIKFEFDSETSGSARSFA